ncbi:extracellular solute-binding protein [Cryptosporangium sp. NPDC048952]|uniref:extracellular solute-binding protein n=1 Tax=Cryptosporangium sp. NPDC048952 TaxID=3363961 RepID=UPI0037214BE6
MAGTRRRALGAWIRRAGRSARRHPGRTGAMAGFLVGVLLVGLVLYAYPSLTGDEWEDGEIVLLSGQDDSAGDQRQALIEEWNQLHPDHRARIEEVNSIADAERSEMLARADGDGSDVDVLNLDVAWLPEFAEAGLLRKFPDDRVDRDAFLRQPLTSCEYDGTLWALPFNTDAGLLYQRSDLVKRAPTTWEDMRAETAGVLGGDPPKGTVPDAGFVTQLDDYEGLTVNALEAVWSTGGEIVDDEGEVRVDSAAASEGLLRLVNGVRPDGDAWPMILRESLVLSEQPSTTAFRNGRALFLRMWPVAYRTLTDPGESGTTGVKFAVSPLPWPSVLGGQNLAIAKRSEHPRAARALIEFLTDSRSQQILFERGGFAATRKVVYTDAEVKRRYPYADELYKAVEGARLRPRSPHYALFSEVLREAVHEGLVTGAWPPPHLADDLRAALRGQRR